MTSSPAATVPRPQPKRSPLAFFLLTFVLTIPFLVLGAATGLSLLPGLPIAALAAICPGLAALILCAREGGGGAAALLKRSFDFRRIPALAWYALILLIAPGVAALSWGVMRLTGTPVPAPHFTALTALGLAAAFFVFALGEELGWSGYAIGPLQARWGALRASLVLGVVWASVHYVPLVEAHRSLAWIAWWTLGTVSTRVIMVWLFYRTGRSVFGASLFHMSINLAWQLFPVSGSYFDPRIHGLIMALVAVVLVVAWPSAKAAAPTSRPAR
jgi:membrane protease YdiL (CAAX protease family)